MRKLELLKAKKDEDNFKKTFQQSIKFAPELHSQVNKFLTRRATALNASFLRYLESKEAKSGEKGMSTTERRRSLLLKHQETPNIKEEKKTECKLETVPDDYMRSRASTIAISEDEDREEAPAVRYNSTPGKSFRDLGLGLEESKSAT